MAQGHGSQAVHVASKQASGVPKRTRVMKPMPSEPARRKLTRETAGRYRSEDGRYVVQQQSGPWWVQDTEQTDELGQPALHGPYASLSEATDAVADLPPDSGRAASKPATKRAKRR